MYESGNTPLHETEYVFNDASEVESTMIDTVQTDYVYDGASQLEQESRSGYTCDYTYDDNGNRLTKTLNSVTETYVYNAFEQLEEITGGSDPREFTYDDGGRTATIDRGSGDVTNFTYDEGSRVTQITRPGLTTNAYSYNGLDTWVGMTDSLGSSGFNRDGAYVTDSVLNDGTRAYTPGISQRQSSATKFVLDDYLGTTGRLLDAGENVTDTFTYDAFGVQTARTGSTVRPFGYAGAHGYQEDGDTGFKLLGHRFYDPSTGRFLTRDPIKDGTNWYAYCENNPLSRVDPEGLTDWKFGGGAASNKQSPEDAEWTVIVVSVDHQDAWELAPGENSKWGLDVDYVVLIHKRTGRVRIFKVANGSRINVYKTKAKAKGPWVYDPFEVPELGSRKGSPGGEMNFDDVYKIPAKRGKMPRGAKPRLGPARA